MTDSAFPEGSMGQEQAVAVAVEALSKAMLHIEAALKSGAISKTEGRIALASIGEILTESTARSLSPEETSSVNFFCAQMLSQMGQ